MVLIAKIQYKNFELGEYTDKKPRDYQDIARIIHDFPWEQQRDHMTVGLTSPSVTLEGSNGDFLKLALYYEGKFVLYYLSSETQLYSKSFTHYSEALPFVEDFFRSNPFDYSQFRHEHLWLQGKTIHFKDKDFRYSLPVLRVALVGSMLAALFLFYVFMFAGFLLSDIPTKIKSWILIFPCLVLLVTTFLGTIFINAWLASRNKTLIISRGSPIFYYGNKNAPEKFDKKDIKELVDFGPSWRTHQYGYSVDGFIRIEMASPLSRYLYIPKFLISETTLLGKFTEFPVRRKGGFFRLIPLIADSPPD